MTEIVFARTRYVYPSYTDFWRLVELSDYPTVYLDEIDLLDRNTTYISAPFNGEFFELEDRPRKCKLYLWNLERPSGSGNINRYIYHMHKHMRKGYMDGVIVSDIALSERTNFKYVPVGSHEGLGSPGTDKMYDFIHLMCYSNRRAFLFNAPDINKSEFAGCSIAVNGWGEERHIRLQQSKYMLNVHQDEDQFMEPLRFALAAAYGLVILTENLYKKSPPYDGDGVIAFPYPGVMGAMGRAVHMYDELKDSGYRLRELMTGPYSFRSCIERYLK